MTGRRSEVARTLNADAPGAEVVADPLAGVPLPADLLRDDEVILYIGRPSMLYVPLVSATSVAMLIGVSFFLAWLSHYVERWSGVGDTAILAVGLALCLVRLGWQTLDWFGRIHVLTDQRLITRTGVARVSIFQTRLRNVQHTTIFCRMRERCFGLGTIAFATAGSDSFETFWLMVRNPVEVQRKVVEAMNRYR